MTTLQSKKRRWLGNWFALTFGLLPLAIAACGNPQAIQPELTQQQVIGTWTSQSGSAVAFGPGHVLVVRHVNISPGVPGCGTVSGTGTWQFLSPTGSTGRSLNTYDKGNLLMVLMPSIREACNGWELTTGSGSSQVTLCVASDPDSPCSSETFARESNG
jgi:hypothetical protein